MSIGICSRSFVSLALIEFLNYGPELLLNLAKIANKMDDLVIEDTDGLKELSDWLFGRVADDNDIVVDKVSHDFHLVIIAIMIDFS